MEDDGLRVLPGGARPGPAARDLPLPARVLGVLAATV